MKVALMQQNSRRPQKKRPRWTTCPTPCLIVMSHDSITLSLQQIVLVKHQKRVIDFSLHPYDRLGKQISNKTALVDHFRDSKGFADLEEGFCWN